MTLRAFAGVPGADLAAALEIVANEAANALSAGPDTPLGRYTAWAHKAVTRLNRLLGSDDLDRLLLTPRHWVLMTAPASIIPASQKLALLELEERARAITAAATDIREQIKWWQAMPGHLVIPDTNLLMEHPHTLDYIDWHETAGVHDLQGLTLVIPFMVIDELDNLKRSKGRSRARQTLKLLHPFVQSGLMGPHVLHQDEDRPVRLAFLSDPVGHRRLTRADEEIVERGGALQQLLDRRVTVVTYDTGMALRNHLGKQDVVHLEDS